MFLTVHGTAGALVGALAPDPVSAFALGVLSHVVLDIIPHGDENLGPQCAGPTCTHREEARFASKLGIIDGVIMCGALALLLTPWVRMPATTVLWGIAGGVIPDVLQGLGMMFPKIRPFARFKELHDYNHAHIIRYDPPLALGMVVQVVTLVAIVIATVRLT